MSGVFFPCGAGVLKITWLLTNVAPKEVLAMVKCNCVVGDCSSQRCACHKSMLPCTDVCGCRTCSTKPGSSHLTSSTTTSESVEDSSDSSDCGSDSDPEPADQNDAAT